MKKLFLFFIFTIFSLAGMYEDNLHLQRETLQKNMLEHQYTPILRDTGKTYTQLQPPTYAKKYDVKRFDESAIFYLWYENGENFIRVVPKTSSFFTCSASFAVVQNGVQYDMQLLQKENGDSFCDNLLIPVTFKIASYNFGDKFDDSVPLDTILFEGYESKTKIYHFSVGIGEEQSSQNSSKTDCLPIIKQHSDPNRVKVQIVGKSFGIEGYYIHYGNGDYQWLYIPSDLSQVYKLEKGIDQKYHLRWLLINGVKATKDGDKISFTSP